MQFNGRVEQNEAIADDEQSSDALNELPLSDSPEFRHSPKIYGLELRVNLRLSFPFRLHFMS